MKSNARVVMILSGILLLGALPRALYLSELRSDAYSLSPGLDGAYHSYWARCIADGDTPPPFGDNDPEIFLHPYFRPPGYPYFLALTGLGGHGDPIAPWIVQMVLGLVSVALLYRLGRQVFGSPVGLIAAAFAALSWVLIYFEGELLEPSLLLALTLLLLNTLAGWCAHRRALTALAAGILLGLCALTRPSVLLFGAVVPAWMWWCSHRAGFPPRTALAPAAAFLVGAAVTIAPATLRNYAVAREFVAISANAGINLHFGNNEFADGYTASSPEVGAWSCFDYPRIVRDLERQEARPLGYSGASAYFVRMAMAYARQHPGRVARLLARKTALFWGPAEIGNNKEYYYDRLSSPVLRLLPLEFQHVLALALVGFLMVLRGARSAPEGDGRRRETITLLVVFVLAYFASHLPFIVAGRYRVPILPVLFLFAACAVQGFAGLVRRRAFLEAGAWLAAAAGILVAASVNWGGYVPDRARWHYERGLAYIRLGEISQGIAECDEALRTRERYGAEPGNHPAMLAPANVMEEATDYYQEAVESQPDSAVLHNNLGVFLFGRGWAREAIAHFRRALELNPDYPAAKSNLERALLAQRKPRIEPTTIRARQ